VIVSTADVTTGSSAGGIRILRKPFNLRDLREAAAAVWSAADQA
jgi:hypothetical protein